MNNSIEIVTTNGFRRLITKEVVATIGELRKVMGRSNTVIVLKNGETIFADDLFEDVIEQYKNTGVSE